MCIASGFKVTTRVKQDEYYRLGLRFDWSGLIRIFTDYNVKILNTAETGDGFPCFCIF